MQVQGNGRAPEVLLAGDLSITALGGLTLVVVLVWDDRGGPVEEAGPVAVVAAAAVSN